MGVPNRVGCRTKEPPAFSKAIALSSWLKIAGASASSSGVGRLYKRNVDVQFRTLAWPRVDREFAAHRPDTLLDTREAQTTFTFSRLDLFQVESDSVIADGAPYE